MPEAPRPGMKARLSLGALVSGRGSNLQAIMEAIDGGKLAAEVSVVISDQAAAPALEKARGRGIEALFLDPAAFPDRETYDSALAAELKRRGVGLVVLAGFMRIITPAFIRAFPMRIMNIHPALLPAFPGLHVQSKALRHGVKFSGCTVHFVDEGVDTGPIIIQAAVPVLDSDTEESLAARILRQEHLIYPRAIQLFAEGRLSVEGRRVLAAGASPAEGERLVNPVLEG